MSKDLSSIFPVGIFDEIEDKKEVKNNLSTQDPSSREAELKRLIDSLAKLAIKVGYNDFNPSEGDSNYFLNKIKKQQEVFNNNDQEVKKKQTYISDILKSWSPLCQILESQVQDPSKSANIKKTLIALKDSMGVCMEGPISVGYDELEKWRPNSSLHPRFIEELKLTIISLVRKIDTIANIPDDDFETHIGNQVLRHLAKMKMVSTKAAPDNEDYWKEARKPIFTVIERVFENEEKRYLSRDAILKFLNSIYVVEFFKIIKEYSRYRNLNDSTEIEGKPVKLYSQLQVNLETLTKKLDIELTEFITSTDDYSRSFIKKEWSESSLAEQFFYLMDKTSQYVEKVSGNYLEEDKSAVDLHSLIETSSIFSIRKAIQNGITSEWLNRESAGRTPLMAAIVNVRTDPFYGYHKFDLLLVIADDKELSGKQQPEILPNLLAQAKAASSNEDKSNPPAVLIKHNNKIYMYRGPKHQVQGLLELDSKEAQNISDYFITTKLVKSDAIPETIYQEIIFLKTGYPSSAEVCLEPAHQYAVVRTLLEAPGIKLEPSLLTLALGKNCSVTCFKLLVDTLFIKFKNSTELTAALEAAFAEAIKGKYFEKAIYLLQSGKVSIKNHTGKLNETTIMGVKLESILEICSSIESGKPNQNIFQELMLGYNLVLFSLEKKLSDEETIPFAKTYSNMYGPALPVLILMPDDIKLYYYSKTQNKYALMGLDSKEYKAISSQLTLTGASTIIHVDALKKHSIYIQISSFIPACDPQIQLRSLKEILEIVYHQCSRQEALLFFSGYLGSYLEPEILLWLHKKFVENDKAYDLDMLRMYDSRYETPLCYAIRTQQYEYVQIFLELGVDPTITVHGQPSALMLMCRSHVTNDEFSFLLDKLEKFSSLYHLLHFIGPNKENVFTNLLLDGQYEKLIILLSRFVFSDFSIHGFYIEGVFPTPVKDSYLLVRFLDSVLNNNPDIYLLNYISSVKKSIKRPDLQPKETIKILEIIVKQCPTNKSKNLFESITDDKGILTDPEVLLWVSKKIGIHINFYETRPQLIIEEKTSRIIKETPLCTAIRTNRFHLVKKLLDSGADLKSVAEGEPNALMLSAKYSSEKEFKSLLDDLKPDETGYSIINYQDRLNNNVLCEVLKSGEFEKLNSLFSKFPEIELTVSEDSRKYINPEFLFLFEILTGIRYNKPIDLFKELIEKINKSINPECLILILGFIANYLQLTAKYKIFEELKKLINDNLWLIKIPDLERFIPDNYQILLEKNNSNLDLLKRVKEAKEEFYKSIKENDEKLLQGIIEQTPQFLYTRIEDTETESVYYTPFEWAVKHKSLNAIKVFIINLGQEYWDILYPEYLNALKSSQDQEFIAQLRNKAILLAIHSNHYDFLCQIRDVNPGIQSKDDTALLKMILEVKDEKLELGRMVILLVKEKNADIFAQFDGQSLLKIAQGNGYLNLFKDAIQEKLLIAIKEDNQDKFDYLFDFYLEIFNENRIQPDDVLNSFSEALAYGGQGILKKLCRLVDKDIFKSKISLIVKLLFSENATKNKKISSLLLFKKDEVFCTLLQAQDCKQINPILEVDNSFANKKFSDGRSALEIIAKLPKINEDGNFIIQQLLSNGATIYFELSEQSMAAILKNAKAINVLNKFKSRIFDVFIKVCIDGEVEKYKLILQYYPDFLNNFVVGHVKSSPLMFAVYNCRLKLVEQMLKEKDIDLWITNDQNKIAQEMPPFSRSDNHQGDHKQIIMLLKDKCKDEFSTALINQDQAKVEIILKHNPGFTCEIFENGKTPLDLILEGKPNQNTASVINSVLNKRDHLMELDNLVKFYEDKILDLIPRIKGLGLPGVPYWLERLLRAIFMHGVEKGKIYTVKILELCPDFSKIIFPSVGYQYPNRSSIFVAAINNDEKLVDNLLKLECDVLADIDALINYTPVTDQIKRLHKIAFEQALQRKNYAQMMELINAKKIVVENPRDLLSRIPGKIVYNVDLIRLFLEIYKNADKENDSSNDEILCKFYPIIYRKFCEIQNQINNPMLGNIFKIYPKLYQVKEDQRLQKQRLDKLTGVLTTKLISCFIFDNKKVSKDVYLWWKKRIDGDLVRIETDEKSGVDIKESYAKILKVESSPARILLLSDYINLIYRQQSMKYLYEEEKKAEPQSIDQILLDLLKPLTQEQNWTNKGIGFFKRHIPTGIDFINQNNGVQFSAICDELRRRLNQPRLRSDQTTALYELILAIGNVSVSKEFTNISDSSHRLAMTHTIQKLLNIFRETWKLPLPTETMTTVPDLKLAQNSGMVPWRKAVIPG